MIQMTDKADSDKSHDRLADVAELYWIQGLKIERVARELDFTLNGFQTHCKGQKGACH